MVMVGISAPLVFTAKLVPLNRCDAPLEATATGRDWVCVIFVRKGIIALEIQQTTPCTHA